MEEFIGVVLPYAGAKAPTGWLCCDGSSVDIAKFPALFSIIGNTYGGDGITKFALPDLSGRMVFGTGTGVGLTRRDLSQKGGSASVTINVQSMASHSHPSNASNLNADTNSPENSFLTITEKERYCSPTKSEGDKEVAMSTEIIGLSEGSALPHDNMPPFLAINYIICCEGIYPDLP